MRTPRFFSALVVALAVTAGWAIAEEPKRLPGLTALACDVIFGEPSPGSEPAKIYHMLIFYKAGGPACSGPAAKDFEKDAGKALVEKSAFQFILETLKKSPKEKTFIVLVGVLHADSKTEKTYVVPSIFTIMKTKDGTFQGFKVIGSRRLKQGRFVRAMDEDDILNMVGGQEFVIFGRAPQGAASESLDPRFFEIMVDPYIAYLTSTVNLECSEEKHAT